MRALASFSPVWGALRPFTPHGGRSCAPRSSGSHVCGSVQQENPGPDPVAGGCLQGAALPAGKVFPPQPCARAGARAGVRAGARTWQTPGSGGTHRGTELPAVISDPRASPVPGPLHRFWPLGPLGHQESFGVSWKNWGARESTSAEVLPVPLKVIYSQRPGRRAKANPGHRERRRSGSRGGGRGR